MEVAMDEARLACTSSDECGAQKVRPQIDGLPELRAQILQLLNTRLSESSIMGLQEELRLMQRSSYYLEIQRDDMPPNVDQQHHGLHLSDSTMWALIDQRRLQHALALANTQVRLLLTLLEMLFQEIVASYRELEAFIVKYDQGLVDSNMAASMQQKLQQTHQYVSDFKGRMIRNLGPLVLQKQLIPNTGHYPMPQLRATVVTKMPVIFNRFESRSTSNTVHLCWEVAGEGSKEPNQQFEIHVKRLHPTTAEDGHLTKSICKSYSIRVNNLIPDRYHQFSVKRIGAVNFVYGMWIDTLILKTLASSK